MLRSKQIIVHLQMSARAETGDQLVFGDDPTGDEKSSSECRLSRGECKLSGTDLMKCHVNVHK